MKRATIFLALLALTSIAIGCDDKRIQNLEKRVSNLVEKTKPLESDKIKAADEASQKEFLLKACVADANDQYQKNIVSNGTKGRGGTYSLPITAMNALDRQKQSKIEECKLLYR